MNLFARATDFRRGQNLIQPNALPRPPQRCNSFMPETFGKVATDSRNLEEQHVAEVDLGGERRWCRGRACQLIQLRMRRLNRVQRMMKRIDLRPAVIIDLLHFYPPILPQMSVH